MFIQYNFGYFLKSSWQPIHYASAAGHEDIIVELVDKHGVSSNVQTSVSDDYN